MALPTPACTGPSRTRCGVSAAWPLARTCQQAAEALNLIDVFDLEFAMFDSTKICAAAIWAMGGGLGVAAFPAHSQDTPQRVEVTGSAIKSIDAETAVPVTILKMDELKKEGVVSVEQVLQRLAVSTSQQSTSQVVGAGTGGASFADVRGIGTNKTLVLLNGRRLANNAIDGATPDLNMIPIAALERVEVLRDGASALYGTDAIGGVINFITKRDYAQGEISLNATVPQRPGGKSKGINGAIGFGELESDRFNVMGVFDYRKTDRIDSQDRDFGARAFIPERGLDGTSGTTFPANYSQTQGTTVFNANPSLPGCAPIGRGGSINVGGSATACRFDPTPFQDLVPKTEGGSIFGKGSLKVNDDMVLSGEYFYARNKIVTNIGPVPQTGLTMTNASPFFPGNGNTPLPTNFTLDPNLPIDVNWRATDAGGRQGVDENTNQRFVLQLEGSTAGWDYNAAATWNQTKLTSKLTGGYSNDALIAAGVSNGILNPFGPQTAAGLAYLQDAALRGLLQTGKGTVYGLDGRASREIGDWLGAGRQAAIALGAEFRHEKYAQDINAAVASQAASTGVDPDSDVSGKRNVSALYAELNVPLHATLDATAALRHDRYSDFGNTTNPKLSLRYQPVPGFLARASYSTGFRAPSLYELFQPPLLTFTGGVYDDPVLCPGGNPAPGAIEGRDCNQQFLQQNGGNANLKPEKAKNYTLGFQFEPVQNLSFGVDFWWVKLRNSINPFPEQAIFGDPVRYAGRFHRAPDGSLRTDGDDPGFIIATNDNLGEINTHGIDVNASYRYKLETSGTISVGVVGSYVAKYEFQREIDGPFLQNAGRFIDFGVIPRWKHSLTAAYSASNWSVGVNNTFTRGYHDENLVDAEFFNDVGDYSLWDLFASFSPTKALTISAGVKNVFDKDPPFSNQNQTFQAGYDPRYTDPTGRAFWATLNYAFK
jgi:iron complex outermembrane recepter protein